MPRSPNKATVDVTILLGQTPNFSFATNDTNIQIGPDNVITFANNGRPGFLIDYRLVNPPGGYVFPGNQVANNLAEALWSAVGPDGCPNTAGQWQQFQAKSVKSQGLILEVWNRNECEAQFGYVLRVTNDNGASYLALDPGGFNQNGSQSLTTISPLAAGIVGAVAGAAATLGAQALLK